ncbi:DUF3533 domain-containing protein [Acidothermaceae bacterium B102]|nr:DUF3533 domain-containing protein [Acidothermaceae bacterium B102]
MSTARKMIALTLGASLFSALFVLSYGYAIHSPRPHALRLAVAASPATTHAIRDDLDKALPGGFSVLEVATEAEARRDVLDTIALGALVVSPSGPAELITAGAGGMSAQQTVTTALTAVAKAEGRTVRSVDVAPLPVGDRAGQSSFVYEIGLLIPGVIGSVGFYLLGRRARLWVRVAAATGYAVFSSTLGVLVLDLGLGALTGSPWTLIATGSLVAAAIVLTVATLHALLGLPGTAVAGGGLLVVGNAVNGSTVPIPMLPGGYREIAPWLPNAAAVRAFRDDVYFHGHGMAQPLLALALWAGVALVIIAAVDVVHARQRRAALVDHARIHATPLLTHLRSRRRLATADVT